MTNSPNPHANLRRTRAIAAAEKRVVAAARAKRAANLAWNATGLLPATDVDREFNRAVDDLNALVAQAGPQAEASEA